MTDFQKKMKQNLKTLFYQSIATLEIFKNHVDGLSALNY